MVCGHLDLELGCWWGKFFGICKLEREIISRGLGLGWGSGWLC